MITITRWVRRISWPGSGFAAWGISASRSGEPANDDQLTLMSTTSPRRLRRESTNPGSSLANDAVYGHHAPSRSSPSSAAMVSRTGRARRRPQAALFMTT